jgi:hypothetical protein
MFESISWQEFFTTVVLLVGGYYAFTLVLLFSAEIFNIFKQNNSNISATQTNSDQNGSFESHDLMGSARYEIREQKNVPREAITSAEEVRVVSLQKGEEAIRVVDAFDDLLINEFVRIQNEITSLVSVVPNTSKEESILLFKTLLSNYPQFIDTAYQHQVSHLICNSCKQACPHHFELSEINSWWTD